ncbi:uncharacterized protein BDW43DRAFT_32977 [Aspergillus alliaceus]|uniref:uncharacterized protein n=1 Tax=Petromyces alliaceus TaxID=209559 RepID=UPI0012A63968|nr:uncharacterized protein BDW43DRAFT_32977 [Aspergillus alliaceus]KAB8235446.1 hypothetical protein BDW43DRAFT_32977 [Aspergillus alliaceus]
MGKLWKLLLLCLLVTLSCLANICNILLNNIANVAKNIYGADSFPMTQIDYSSIHAIHIHPCYISKTIPRISLVRLAASH